MAERIQQRRTKGWRKPANTVSVARPGKYGNPFKVGGTVMWIIEGGPVPIPIPDAATAVQMHRRWMQNPGKPSPYVGIGVPPDLTELRGKSLMCFCALDQPCHVSTLLELANR